MTIEVYCCTYILSSQGIINKWSLLEINGGFGIWKKQFIKYIYIICNLFQMVSPFLLYKDKISFKF